MKNIRKACVFLILLLATTAAPLLSFEAKTLIAEEEAVPEVVTPTVKEETPTVEEETPKEDKANCVKDEEKKLVVADEEDQNEDQEINNDDEGKLTV